MNSFFNRHGAIATALAVLYLIHVLPVNGQPATAIPIQEYVFLIDTSASMVGNKLVGPLRVALNDFTDTIPTDGSSRIWIFTFDRGLGRQVIEKTIEQSRDLQEVKVFLMERAFTGDATYIYRSLDGVLVRIERAVSDGRRRDVIIHLFTDGEDNDSFGRVRFQDNVDRIKALRQKTGVTIDLYYHGLGVKADRATDSLIKQTDGIYFVDGITVAPRARFMPSTTTPTDATPVTFVNTSIGAADHWRWEFGDGAVSTERSPTHTFRDPGTFTVRLTASNRGGAHAAATRITVAGGPPKARFAVADPEKPKYVGNPVRFSDQSEGRVATYAWDFGDGQGKSMDRNPEYVYKQAGTFEVVLVATGPFGKDQATTFVKVSQEPVVAFSYFPDPPKHGREVKFSNDSVGEYKAWAWDFGDGARSHDPSPTHIFAKPGNYTVALSGDPVEGDSRRMQKPVMVVSADLPPVAIISADERIRQGEVSVGAALSFHSTPAARSLAASGTLAMVPRLRAPP